MKSCNKSYTKQIKSNNTIVKTLRDLLATHPRLQGTLYAQFGDVELGFGCI